MDRVGFDAPVEMAVRDGRVRDFEAKVGPAARPPACEKGASVEPSAGAFAQASPSMSGGCVLAGGICRGGPGPSGAPACPEAGVSLSLWGSQPARLLTLPILHSVQKWWGLESAMAWTAGPEGVRQSSLGVAPAAQ